jgi:N-acylglucosamine 2-epimerase
MNLKALRELYNNTLHHDVLPFWTRHAIDANGGINTCIADDGKIISRDRWNWSQWRAVWVFSKLYNTVEKRPEWLKIARNIYQFVTAHGPMENGHWPLLLDGEGKLLRGYESIYVDGFALYGMTEFFKATGDPAVRTLAMKTYQSVQVALKSKEELPQWPYPLSADKKPHGKSMMFSLIYDELAEAIGDHEIRDEADYHYRQVMDVFLRPESGFLLERLRLNDQLLPSPEGTAVVPGHAIESMWFQIHIARTRNDQARIDRAVKAIRFHLEKGWDTQYGGLFLAIDAEGRDEIGWGFPDTKLWWPHTEALYATLLAYEHCREDWCLEWHERIREYSYAHYPVKEYGEWRQKLDRQGKPMTQVVALPVKDPFHLPRALMYCVEVLDRLLAEKK